eukprot:2921156-Pyramimonas_sp.AAC.1
MVRGDCARRWCEVTARGDCARRLCEATVRGDCARRLCEATVRGSGAHLHRGRPGPRVQRAVPAVLSEQAAKEARVGPGGGGHLRRGGGYIPRTSTNRASGGGSIFPGRAPIASAPPRQRQAGGAGGIQKRPRRAGVPPQARHGHLAPAGSSRERGQE